MCLLIAKIISDVFGIKSQRYINIHFQFSKGLIVKGKKRASRTINFFGMSFDQI